MTYLVSTKNHLLNVHDYGIPGGRTILAIPGLGLTAGTFRSYFVELSALWTDSPLRMVGVNRPGLDSPPCEYCPALTLTDVAQMHLQVADELSLDFFDLIGHSFGGPVVLKIAELAPDRVRTIFIIDGAVYGAFLPSPFDGDPADGVIRIDSEKFASEFGQTQQTGHPTGIAIKSEQLWPALPDDPLGGWLSFSKVWRRSYRHIIAPYLGAVLIQTSLGHQMHDSEPESLGEGRYISGNPRAIAQFHAGILAAYNHPKHRIEISPSALDAAGAHIAYDPTCDSNSHNPQQTLAELNKYRGVYLPRQRGVETTALLESEDITKSF